MAQDHLITAGASPTFKDWVRRVGELGDHTKLEYLIDVSLEQLINNDKALSLLTSHAVNSFISGAISAAADQFAFVVPTSLADYVFDGARIYLLTAPTDADFIIDVHKNGTTMYTTQANRPTVAATENDSGDRVAPDVIAIAAGDIITVDVDQVGSTVAGSDLAITLVFVQA